MDLQNGNIGEASEDSGNKKSVYSIPGILHFIQHEWSRFEIDRAQWDVERAELQARIAFLQGERKGQENLKRDLIRRIKMLEYALKQERAKVHKYKFGTDLKVDAKLVDSDDSRSSGGDVSLSQPNMTWRHGRQLLRQYLQEVGYSDTILDVRSQRVRALLGTNYDVTNKDNDNKMTNGDSPGQEKPKSPDFSQEKGEPTESDVMREFNFLAGVDDEEEVAFDDVDGGDQQRSSRAPKTDFDQDDKFNGAEFALAEFAFLTREEQEMDPKATDWSVDHDKLNSMKEQFRHEKRQTKRRGMKRPDKKNLKSMIDTLRGSETGGDDPHINTDDNLPFVGGRGGDGSIESAFGLGELAGLTVANEADPLSFEISGSKETFRRTWQPKFSLRSHFDGVRAVRFLRSDAALLTASEDHTLKLWNLNKTLAGRRAQPHDVEPVYCFRGHTGPVLCLTLDTNGSTCFSAGVDTTIRCWNIPSIDIDPFDSYDASVEGQTLIGHTDAVWSLSYCGPRQQLLSASSDMTLKLWDPQSHDPLLQTLPVEGDAAPTCVEFVRCDTNQAVVSHSDGRINLIDLNMGKTIQTYTEGDGSRVSCVASHPTMPLTISAHDDGHIKFFDNLTGKTTHSMVAHLDSVSSLAVDPSGLYLLSGSHDCSVRLWNLDNKTCVQELTAHRRKFDEAIHSVAFHDNASLIASGGADSLAKVFV